MSEVTKQKSDSPSRATVSPFGAFQEEMDRMFHAFSMPQLPWRSGMGQGKGALGLRVDIAESDGEIQVQTDLPGVPEEAVEVTLDHDVLRIHAEKKSQSEKSDTTWLVAERSHGVFERAIRVPAGIDPDQVSAHFDKGVLTVTLPKPAETQGSARRIAVKPAG
ncbi:MAG: hypothetical protein Kilf2KO_30280 [Rhodospirillales bacterium]